MGTGIGHYIPLAFYLGCFVMAIRALTGKPLQTFYFVILLIPYRTMRDHFLGYPLGPNVLTILVLSIIVGAIIQGKRLPKSRLYLIWLIMGVYLYFSMWLGFALGHANAPLWIHDLNFSTWKDYMMIPLIFVAAGLVVEDRKAVRNVILFTAISLLAIDRSSLMDSMSRTWGSFDESKRDGGPLGFAGANGLAAFLAQFAMFFWGFGQFLKRKKARLLCYALVATTLFATMYTFSRAAYLAVVVVAVLLGIMKDRKLIPIIAIFLFTWQAIVPVAVNERISMTRDSNGQLEASAQERVDLWENAKKSFYSEPIFGNGYATFQYGDHVADLKDTHNWYVKVLVETGIVGGLLALLMLQQMLALSYGLFRRAKDPLYRGFGFGLFLTICASIILNCFGDRWTYVEVTGLIWALVGTAASAANFVEAPSTDAKLAALDSSTAVNPYMAYH
ncbi:O-antigen ligase family protein [Edaphobacter paludis]|uniref:O-antigen ligase family protein n=1 Tax=Edaphobacter paludis TaxID=3035702 RepID=A0AAU7D7Q6_9BACT